MKRKPEEGPHKGEKTLSAQLEETLEATRQAWRTSEQTAEENLSELSDAALQERAASKEGEGWAVAAELARRAQAQARAEAEQRVMAFMDGAGQRKRRRLEGKPTAKQSKKRKPSPQEQWKTVGLWVLGIAGVGTAAWLVRRASQERRQRRERQRQRLHEAWNTPRPVELDQESLAPVVDTLVGDALTNAVGKAFADGKAVQHVHATKVVREVVQEAVPGPPGPRGKSGRAGPRGPGGPRGRAGARGTQGRRGRDGRDGVAPLHKGPAKKGRGLLDD